MGKNPNYCGGVENRRTDGPPCLRRSDVVRFAAKYRFAEGRDPYLITIKQGVSTIEIVSALRRAAIVELGVERSDSKDVGDALIRVADEITGQCLWPTIESD